MTRRAAILSRRLKTALTAAGTYVSVYAYMSYS